MQCRICGKEEFVGHQVIRALVICDGDGGFLSNMTDGLSASIYDSEKPYGPFECNYCGAEYEDLTEGAAMISGPVLFARNLENYWGHAVQLELHEQPDGRFMPTVPSGSPFSLIKGADKPITLDEVKEIVKNAKFINDSWLVTQNPEMVEEAMNLISDFCNQEYGVNDAEDCGCSDDDLSKIPVGYTTITDADIPIQVYVNLTKLRIEQHIGGNSETRMIICYPQYNSLAAFIRQELDCLDFDTLVWVDDEEIKKYLDAEAAGQKEIYIQIAPPNIR